MITELAIGAGATLMGACVGSYASTVAVRLARDEPSTSGRSHCDGCGLVLGFGATVPVISYVSRRGVCAGCGARIDPLHPIGEVAGAAVALAAVASAPLPRGALLAGLGLTLLGAVLVDVKTRRLPDLLTGITAIFALALAFEAGGARGAILGLVGGAVTFGVLELLRRGFLWMRRKPGLGFGDVKLAAALAIWLGIATPWAIVAASLLGLATFVVARPADGRIPFGPALALGAFGVGLLREVHAWPLS